MKYDVIICRVENTSARWQKGETKSYSFYCVWGIVSKLIGQRRNRQDLQFPFDVSRPVIVDHVTKFAGNFPSRGTLCLVAVQQRMAELARAAIFIRSFTPTPPFPFKTTTHTFHTLFQDTLSISVIAYFYLFFCDSSYIYSRRPLSDPHYLINYAYFSF